MIENSRETFLHRYGYPIGFTFPPRIQLDSLFYLLLFIAIISPYTGVGSPKPPETSTICPVV